MSGHDTFSPSRLAFLDHCLDWQGCEDSEDAAYGTMMHALIHKMATTAGPVEGDPNDLHRARKSLTWLYSIPNVGDWEWGFETKVPGHIPDTGGTIDASHVNLKERCAIIVDWKGSLPPADSMQGKAYALNLWHQMGRDKLDKITVVFYNYMDGSNVAAEYANPEALESEIRALIRRHGGQMGNRRVAHYGCGYCQHRGNCAAAADSTATALASIDGAAALSLPDALAMYAKLAEVMKRAEPIQSALKDRLMAAAEAGELPGYGVKNKRGNKVEWVDESLALTNVQAILSENFASAKVMGLLPPAQVKAAVKAALAESYTAETEAAIVSLTRQNTYKVLHKGAYSCRA